MTAARQETRAAGTPQPAVRAAAEPGVPPSARPAAAPRFVALPVLDCPRCAHPHVPSMADPRCGACLRFLRQRQERRKERAAEYWAEFAASRSEAPK